MGRVKYPLHVPMPITDYARPEPRKSDSYATVACGFLLIVTVMGWAFLLVVMGGAT